MLELWDSGDFNNISEVPIFAELCNYICSPHDTLLRRVKTYCVISHSFSALHGKLNKPPYVDTMSVCWSVTKY
jgi:hypothetical protein